MNCDFSGWATKAGLKCKDGKTINHGAFKDLDGVQVPLVWSHGHSDVENVLGHAILEHREEGVYTYCFFNDSPKAQHAALAVENRDVNAMSIYANDLVMRAGVVLHGVIREVSLVLAGANPGALIDSVTIRHGEDMIDLEDEVVIFTGLELEHAAPEDDDDDLLHADDEEETIADVLASMTPKQRDVCMALVGEAITNSNAAQHSDDFSLNLSNLDLTGLADTPDNKDETDMENGLKHNLFEGGNGKEGKKERVVLAHDAMKNVLDAALNKKQMFSEAIGDYALEHGIENIDLLFPDARAISNTPEFLSRRTEWVASFLGMTTKTPFSRIKTLSANLTEDQARAKGYITGEFKKEQFFPIAKRVTTPVTVYKKQKLDRDDLIDITDFDVVAWLKAEMRLMLDEEVARAGLIGDGRDISDEDKINEQNIRPIAGDHELFTTQIYVNLGDSNSSIQEMIDALITNRPKLKGSGLPTMYTTETVISKFLMLRDQVGRDIYRDITELATKLRYRDIVAVEVMEETPEILAVIVNPIDYTFGATQGGAVSLFDDFDIDYNQYKYLIETRCCGALTKLKAAMCVRSVLSSLALVVPAEPAFNQETGAVTITNQTGVVYKNGAGTIINAAGSPYATPEGQTYTVKAFPDTGYYFETSDDDEWNFHRPA
jgi:hypothetical protein